MGRGRRRTAGVAAGATLAMLAVPAGANATEQLYGVTDDGDLVHFTAEAPGAVTKVVGIDGLATGERIVGIDVRPETDQLFALSSASRIYRLNPVTGRTLAVGTGPFAPALVGTNFGMDFNPVVDRIRVVSDADQNLRVNPDTGQVTANDAPLNYAPGDPGAGTNPTVTAVAYTNNLPTATSTTLFGIDSGRDTLVRHDPPNAGRLNTVGALGVDAPDVNGFDIASDNNAYAVFTGEGGSSLYRINTTSGAATLAAGTTRSSVGGNRSIVALAAAGQVPDDNTRPRMLLQAEATQDDRRVLRAGVDAAASCSETCNLRATVRRSGRRLGTTTGFVRSAGFDSVDVRLNSRGRRLVRRGAVRLRLTVSATDAAGNRTTKSKTITVR